VEQADWLTPRREDWVAALAEAIAADSTPVILIAHSLGCITVAHWAATAPVHFLRQVRGALLVAPADVERPACAPALRNFAPIPTHLLPFPSQVPSAPPAPWSWPATGAPRPAFCPEPGISM
jgi:predicted alpha/beta hydrolase family esterase